MSRNFAEARNQIINELIEEMGYEDALKWCKHHTNQQIIEDLAKEKVKSKSLRDLDSLVKPRKSRITHNKNKETFSLV